MSADSYPDLERKDVLSIIVGLMLAMLLGALDQTIVATAMPTIGRDLGDIEHMPWIVTAYLLAAVAITPLSGKLSDIYGRRPVLLAAIIIFVLGSVGCALAPSMLVLALARAVQGIGGGGLISLAQTIIADMVPPRERARYQVYIASVFVTSSLAGPGAGRLSCRACSLVGNFLDQCATWHRRFHDDQCAAEEITATDASTSPRSARSISAGLRLKHFAVGAELGRHHIFMDVARHHRAFCRSSSRNGLVCLAHQDGGRSTDSTQRTQRSGCANGDCDGRPWHGHVYRFVDLHADLS